jgi:Nucleotidyl transferase AbiEii toxin, Type IV TA system
MFSADVLTFREFMMGEPLPLATLQQAVLEFLRGRDDVVVFGAQAVNAYVNEPRMTQDLDLLSTHADVVAQELCAVLRQRFHIAVRVRRVGAGRGLRVFQVRKSGNRHLVDLRSVESLPGAERIAGVLVLAPAELIASKVIAYHQRRGQPKSGTDWRDLAMLLLTFPARVSTLGGTPCSLNDLPRGPDDAAWAWATRRSLTARSQIDRETTA